MALPPAKSPRKGKVAPAVAKPRTASARVKPPFADATEVAEPYVITAETLSAFADDNETRFASVGAIAAATRQDEAMETDTAREDALSAPAQSETSTPPQPDVADKTNAAEQEAVEERSSPALEGTVIMNEAIETTKKYAEDAKARVQSMLVDYNGKAKSAMEKSSRAASELGDIAKGNLEAFVESSKIAAKGAEAMGQSAAEYGRASFEKTSATLKSFASVKSPMEFMQLHSDLISASFDSLAAQTAQASESLLKLAGDIAQPLSNRAAVVSDKLKTLAA